jgi:hypothetical protein
LDLQRYSQKIKLQPTEWEKMFVSHSPYKGIISRTYEELNSEKPNNPTEKLAKNLNRYFPKEHIQWPTGT